MQKTSRPMFFLAVCLSFLAGYVDALGFIELGGVFVSFMSGNSTRLGVSVAAGDMGLISSLAGVLFCFVAGVVAGSIVGHWQRQRRMTAILSLVTLLLVVTAWTDSVTGIAFMALAMGAVNTLFERDGEVTIALTYMTGTLVRMGQRIAGALLGGPKLLWLRYMLLWLGLVAGAVTGAFAHAQTGLQALWLAAGMAACLTLLATLKKT